MDSIKRSQLWALRYRCEAIANRWYTAIAETGFAPHSAAKVRQRLVKLTEQVISLLLTEPFDHGRAQAIGASLASLHHCIQPEALGKTQEVLARQLVKDLPADRVVALQPRLAALLGGLAVGFFQQARQTILAEQGQIREALVTERKQAEEALRESEARWRSLTETSPDHILTLDTDLNIQFANFASPGLTVEELIGTPLYTYVEEERQPEIKAILESVLRTGEPARYETEYDTEGGTIYYESHVVPRVLAGQVVGLTLNARDITERKQAEKALRESEQKFRSVVEQSHDGISLVDEQGIVVEWNQAMERCIGLKAEDVLGKPIWDVQFQMNLEGQRTPQAYEHLKARLLEFLKTGQAPWADRLLEREYAHPNGTCRVVQGTVYSIRTDRGFILVSAAHDVTERRRAEEALRESEEWYRLLLSSITDGCWVLDRDWRYTLVNETGARLVAMSPGQLLGRKLTELFPGIEKTEFFAAYERSMRERTTENVISSFTLPDGRKGFYEVQVYPAPDGILCIGRDITERVQAEEQLERYAAELEQRNEELREFAYILSHDLRAPLVNIKGFSRELDYALKEMDSILNACLPHIDEKEQARMTTLLQEDVPEALGFISSSVSRMDRLLSAILKLSRLGRRELEPESINMEALVQSILESLAHQIEQHSVRVTVGALPEVVADRISMEQIMGNILGNAVKYLEPGRPGEIEITAEHGPEETIFHIRDNGRGIAEKDRSKVFDLFRRVGKQDVPGEGMGLTYARTLIRRHGGRIRCESEPGVGTTFSFTIPRSDE